MCASMGSYAKCVAGKAFAGTKCIRQTARSAEGATFASMAVVGTVVKCIVTYDHLAAHAMTCFSNRPYAQPDWPHWLSSSFPFFHLRAAARSIRSKYSILRIMLTDVIACQPPVAHSIAVCHFSRCIGPSQSFCFCFCYLTRLCSTGFNGKSRHSTVVVIYNCRVPIPAVTIARHAVRVLIHF